MIFDAHGSAYLSSVTQQLTTTDGRLELSGGFSQAQARQLAAILSYGALPATVQTTVIQQYTNTIPPSGNGS